MKKLIHIAIILFLTIITQIGGIIWLLNFGYYRIKRINKSKYFRIGSFAIIYLVSTLFLVPNLAKINNRTALPFSKSGVLIPHNFITPLLNRNYVCPRLKNDLLVISKKINAENNNLKVSYLDANFPFINGFPLLPHLSHNDGRKIDLSYYYTENGEEGNNKPSNSGYGYFVKPESNKSNQTANCISKGFWQYDYSKFLTLGSRHDLEFDLPNTLKLINLITKNPNTQKLFIEPHLKNRMKLSNAKIRFQGCHSVRHDDHIHYQIN